MFDGGKRVLTGENERIKHNKRIEKWKVYYMGSGSDREILIALPLVQSEK